MKGPARVETSFCRICSGGCGMIVTLDDDEHIVDIRGDKEAPMTRGYACFKGLQAEDAHHGSARLLHSLRRDPDGVHREIASEQALDEIASRLAHLIARHGPDSVAMFMGTPGYGGSLFYALHKNFMKALGSSSLFTTMTIDQPAKIVSFQRQGGWAAGIPDLDEMDVLLLFGSNPLISHTASSILSADSTRRLKAARARGLKLICIDPRLTETARHADVFLQPLPGHDAAIAAGMIRIILERAWHDAAFCEAHVDRQAMHRLRGAVEPFTVPFVEQRASLVPGSLLRATEMFSHEARRGVTFAGTGTCMASHGNLAQHLADTLNILCGRFRRAGDRYRPNPQSPYSPVHAEVIPRHRTWDEFPRSRIHGVGNFFGEKSTGTLAEEILRPGTGQVKALLVIAGNPASCVPDQSKITSALESLELLVVVDPYPTSTARRAHYVIAPTLQYEHPDLPYSIDGFNTYPDCWCRYTPAIMSPPDGSDVVDDWYVLWRLAAKLDIPLTLKGRTLDRDVAPTSDQLFEILLEGSITSLAELKNYPRGKIFSDERWKVLPARAEALDNRFDTMPPDVAVEVDEYLASSTVSGRVHTHLLSSRRRRDFYNTIGQFLPKVRARNLRNPVHLNPADIAQLGLEEGMFVRIESDSGSLETVVEADAGVRPGVASISHGCSNLTGEVTDISHAEKDSVNVLIDSNAPRDSIQSQPRMSAIPVRIVPAGDRS